MVIVDSSDQRGGNSGLPPRASTISNLVVSSKSKLSQKLVLPLGTDLDGDPRGADVRGFLDHLGHGQFGAVVAEIADPVPPHVIGDLVLMIVSGVTRPSSSACATVKILKVDPSS